MFKDLVTNAQKILEVSTHIMLIFYFNIQMNEPWQWQTFLQAK